MPTSERISPSSNLTASLLTPQGRGAVAVIRVHALAPDEAGSAAIAVESAFVAVSGKPLPQQPVGRICYGHWVTEGSKEDVVVCRTGDDSVEVSCHGGRAAVTRILDSLTEAGAAIVDWQTQQKKISSPFECELTDAVSQATTTRTAAFLLEQSSGTLSNALSRLLQFDSPQLTSRLTELLAYSQFGQHLTLPWGVVLAGRPNVGKSTLINALLGYTRAIVFDQPGTTRDVVTGRTAFDGWPFQLADTAGIRNTNDELEQAGIERARRTVKSANLVCLLLDTSHAPTPEDHALLAEFSGATRKGEQPALIVAHKADLPSQWSSPLPDNAIHVSSTTGDGVEELIAQIVQTLIPTVPASDTAIPISQRQMQWLKEANRAAKIGNTARAKASIECCLSGAPFDGESSAS
ncbi:MAG: GTPase [Planctomycetales bacterium]|jgi:tRNA modification GTPase